MTSSNNAAKIYTLGESLLDIIHKDGRKIHSLPGGSVLNTSISLGRLKTGVYLISEYGLDPDGKSIDNFLRNNGVDTTFVYQHTSGKTTRALAYLDQKNEASYRFEKQPPTNRLQVRIPDFECFDFLLFGSWFAVDPDLRQMVLRLVRTARDHGSFVIYDPNFRSSHRDELPALRDSILENMAMADLVRGSHEDFSNIFNEKDPYRVFKIISTHVPALIYTASDKGIYVFHQNRSYQFKVPKIQPVSTIGAGDNFNAGLLYALYRMKISTGTFSTLKKNTWDVVIKIAVACAAHVCGTTENYITEPFAVSLQSLI